MNSALALPLDPALPPDAQADFRQLRHQTKNALTRILAQVSACLPAQGPAQRVAADLERRIMLTAEISDALFGLTRAPATLEERLFSLCTSVVELYGDPDQQLNLRCTVEHAVPAALEGVILRVAHELVGNAIKHGMHMRLVGRINVRLTAVAGAAVLEVADDGWGCGKEPRLGEGLQVASLLAAQYDGTVTLRRSHDVTTATLYLPAQ